MRAALADLLPPTRSNVRWTEDEWSDLALRVWKKRARNPDENLIALINAVQMQQDWPEDRRRKITAMTQVQQLVPLLRKIDLDLLDLRDREVPSLKDQIETLRARPDKDAILQSLHPDEIVRRFTDRVFEHCSPAEIIERFNAHDLLSSIPFAEIFAFVGQFMFGGLTALELRLAEHLLDHQKAGATNGHTNQPLKRIGVVKANGAAKPKIAVIGMQQHYLPVLLSHVGAQCEIILMPKASTKEECASIQADHIVVWENYTTGIQRNAVKQRFHDKLTLHKGTWQQLIQRIESLPILGRKTCKV